MKKLAILFLLMVSAFGVSRAQLFDLNQIGVEIGNAFNEAIKGTDDPDFTGCRYNDGTLIFTLSEGSEVAEAILMQNDPNERKRTVTDMFGLMFDENDGKEIFGILEELEIDFQLVVPDKKSGKNLTYTVSAADIRRNMK